MPAQGINFVLIWQQFPVRIRDRTRWEKLIMTTWENKMAVSFSVEALSTCHNH